jgi:hypothetical protein
VTGRYNFVIVQGEDFDKTLTYKVNGQPVDLTGFTARLQCRETPDAPVKLLELTTENDGIVLGGPAGTIQLLCPAEDNQAFTWRDGVYDLELESGSLQKRLLEGSMSVSPEVTRE